MKLGQSGSSDEDAGSASADDESAQSESSVLTSAVMYLPVFIFKSIACKLCGENSDSANPLPHKDDEASKYRPWRDYNKRKKPGYKVPRGKLCLICWNVFRDLGLQQSICIASFN